MRHNFLECHHGLLKMFLDLLTVKKIKDYGCRFRSEGFTMITHTKKSIKQLKTTKSGSFKSPRIYIWPNDFYLMRRRAFLTTLEASKLLDVTHKTLQNWEKWRVRIPYTAYRVLKIK